MADYEILVEKGWFRGKDVFFYRISHYDRLVAEEQQVRLPLHAGNMIYVLMRRLVVGVDWKKQEALVASYRDLMYKLSYVDVLLSRDDMLHLLFRGYQSDVLWALAFLTQVYPEEPLACQIGDGMVFYIQNGAYVGTNAYKAKKENTSLPDIWSEGWKRMEDPSRGFALTYDPHRRPASGEHFALPDGRIGVYLRMDARFVFAEEREGDALFRHQVSTSLMKDFEDLVASQMDTAAEDYDLYQMRYTALMNKVHELERLLGGLEASVYDLLPVGERGLPYASSETLERTNWMDRYSLQYVMEQLARDTVTDRTAVASFVDQSIVRRLRGYEIEYQTYQQTGTSEDVCRNLYHKYCRELYQDVMRLEGMEWLDLSKETYYVLCNDLSPASGAWSAADMRRMFGRGYASFLSSRYRQVSGEEKILCMRAWTRLQEVYRIS